MRAASRAQVEACPAWCESDTPADHVDHFHERTSVISGAFPVNPVVLKLVRDDHQDGRTLLSIGAEAYIELTESGDQVRQLVDAILELEGLYAAHLSKSEVEQRLAELERGLERLGRQERSAQVAIENVIDELLARYPNLASERGYWADR